MSVAGDITYIVVIVDPVTRRIFSTRSDESNHLPAVSISSFVRAARALTEEIAERFGLCTLQLTSFPGQDGERYSIHELLPCKAVISTSMSLVELTELSDAVLPLPNRLQIRTLLDDRVADLGRYARIGWIHELRRYIGADAIVDIRHINCGTDFCLLSMLCDGRRLWFKGVGIPNTREYAITLELARRFPYLIPPLELAIPEWSGWVAADVVGVPIGDNCDPDAWKHALTGLATIQKGMATSTESLARLGAIDWSSNFFMNVLDDFFEDVERAMRGQTSTRAIAMTRSELAALKQSLHPILQATVIDGIPETLVHGDLGHGNVISSTNQSVILDWAEACLGFPFISSEHLIADLTRSRRLSPSEIGLLRVHYALQWADYIRPSRLNWTVAIAPALASLVQAVTAWERTKSRPSSETAWPLMRSMVRRTAKALEEAGEVRI